MPTKELKPSTQADYAARAEDRPLKAIFSCHKNPFWLYEAYCTNPDCDCQAVGLTFIEISPEEKPLFRGMELGMHLHFHDWHAGITGSRRASQEKVNAILAEFTQGLTSELKERFRKHYLETKRMARRVEQFELSEAEIRSGAQKGYWEIFGEPGDFFSFEFDYGNQKYVIGDQYCLNPDCDCQRAFITFTTIEAKTKAAEDAFGIFLNLDFNKEHEIAFSKYPDARLREIVSAWVQNQPELSSIFANRYEQMKAVGRQLLERSRKPQTGPKAFAGDNISRNAPCPCGSGKKYKKCCGK